MKFSIIGATGNVGRKTIEILEKSSIKIDDLYLVASKKSLGKTFKFKDKKISVEDLSNYDFSRADITFFAAGSQLSQKYASKSLKKNYCYR